MSEATKAAAPRSDRALRAGAKAHVAEAVRIRDATDEIIKGWIIYLPLIAVVVGAVAGMLFALAVGGAAGVGFGVFFAYSLTFALVALMNYRLIRRLEEHVRREGMLRRGAIEFLRSTLEERGAVQQAEIELANLESIEREAAANERVPNPVYAAMGVLPVVGFVLTFYYLRPLTEVPPGHERRWQAFISQFEAGGKKAGMQMMFSAGAPHTQRREFILYLVVSLVFIPFLVYWYWKLIDELNSHFREQWKDEDHLLRELG